LKIDDLKMAHGPQFQTLTEIPKSYWLKEMDELKANNSVVWIENKKGNIAAALSNIICWGYLACAFF
jgi:hypothetical protein